ncbi:MAG: energy-coupling factor ABC transporter ATP-binding protein [Desulfovibrionaceae bacterium]|nr:energy-coupling factor ABC transporter ATP-binding protein [Desulfovibrionaceae bacterium]
MPDAIFSLEKISFAYAGGQELFRDFDFSLAPGERLGLTGPNGSGKTTLLRIILGLEKAVQGRVLLRGTPVFSEKDWRALRLKVGLLLQQSEDQLFCPTVLEDVAFGPLNLGLKQEEARAEALHTLNILGLAGLEKRLTHKLSGGEKKLVALAAILAMRPEALLLDEPTSGLDPENEARLLGILQNATAAMTIVSHDQDFLRRCRARILRLQEGRLEPV